MASPPMQVCMDSSDWLKGIVHEDSGLGSSSPSGELIPCSRSPMMERRLRPQHEQALKCPRCDSTHTKFCYYNNYSLSQPRYFCKTCRRYWTKGGSLRNVPVGGGCRKNKRSAGAKKPNPDQQLHHQSAAAAVAALSFQNVTDLQLSFSGVQLPLADAPRSLDFMDCKYNSALESPAGGLELMEAKYGSMAGSSRAGSGSHLFIGGSSHHDMVLGDASHGFSSGSGFHDLSPLGFSITGNHGALMEACHRLALPFEGQEDPNAVELKPGDHRVLSLEWQDQCCTDAGRESLGYSNSLGLWSGMINGHGSSTTI